MNYRPKHFRLEELVPPDIFKERGEFAWELLDARELITLDALRDNLGIIVVNNWHDGGPYMDSGLRSLAAAIKLGHPWSQHIYGRGTDKRFKSVTPEEARDYIIANRSVFPYLTTIENTDATKSKLTGGQDWLHSDCRNNPTDTIRIVNP